MIGPLELFQSAKSNNPHWLTWTLCTVLVLSGPVTLDQVLRAPGVFQTDEDLAGTEDLWPAMEHALERSCGWNRRRH